MFILIFRSEFLSQFVLLKNANQFVEKDFKNVGYIQSQHSYAVSNAGLCCDWLKELEEFLLHWLSSILS